MNKFYHRLLQSSKYRRSSRATRQIPTSHVIVITKICNNFIRLNNFVGRSHNNIYSVLARSNPFPNMVAWSICIYLTRFNLNMLGSGHMWGIVHHTFLEKCHLIFRTSIIVNTYCEKPINVHFLSYVLMMMV